MAKQYDRREVDRRLSLLHLLILLTLGALVTALVFFQILAVDEYVGLASKNRLRIIRIMPPRGVISDRNGAPLAVNVRTFNVNGYPIDLQRGDNAQKICALLQKNGIPMTEETLKATIAKQYSAPYRAITVASNLTLAQVAELVMEKEFGDMLFVSPVWRRTYPAGPYTAHVVGYVGEITREELDARPNSIYRGGDLVGKNGIEAVYESELQGEAGQEVIEVDSRGRRLREIGYQESQRGSDVKLTIDLTAQRYAAELLENFRGAMVAMDVSDGSIVCLYSAPTYDTNPLTWGISAKEWSELLNQEERPMMNRAISGAYPPASTFKVVTASAALENRIITTRTVVRCPGYFELGDRRFRCWQRHGHGNENVVTALRDSCDVFFYQAATWMGIDKFLATAKKFGVGERTGVDLTSESAGTIAGPAWKKQRVKENWYGGDTVNYSIGQGYLLMTPLQLVRIYAAIANGGKLFTPRVNAAREPEYRSLGVSSEIMDVLRRGLQEVTSSGTGRRASQYGVPVAGKTGTAQNAHGEDHAWFAGYAPVNDPKYAVVVIAEAGQAGSSVAGPMVGKMLNFLVNGVQYEAPKPAPQPKPAAPQ